MSPQPVPVGETDTADNLRLAAYPGIPPLQRSLASGKHCPTGVVLSSGGGVSEL